MTISATLRKFGTVLIALAVLSIAANLSTHPAERVSAQDGGTATAGDLVVVPGVVQQGQTVLAVGLHVVPRDLEVVIRYSGHFTPEGESCDNAGTAGATEAAPAPVWITLNACTIGDTYVRLVESATGSVIDEQSVTITQPDCSNGTAVVNPSDNPGLVTDCQALLAIKDDLQGTGTLNWDPETTIARWDGVIVEGTPKRVTILNLSSSSLTGSIPAGLSDLDALLDLRLANNRLTGSIPSELGDLADLETLWLHNNDLTGAIPPELGDLTELRDLFLGDNQLTGSVPTELGSLSRLRELQLAGNRLTGAIPSELGGLANLQGLYLNRNQLTGCIPPALRNVGRNDLDSLDLQDCAVP